MTSLRGHDSSHQGRHERHTADVVVDHGAVLVWGAVIALSIRAVLLYRREIDDRAAAPHQEGGTPENR